MMYTPWALASAIVVAMAICGIVCSAVLGASPQVAGAGKSGRAPTPSAEAALPNLSTSVPPTTSPAHVSAFDVPAIDSPALEWWRESMKTHDQRIAWWRQARFGMFIHWGVYSRLGGVWHGEPVEGYAEHIMRKSRIPLATYRSEVAGQFDPVNFNADEWVKLAHDAGIGYIVITSKHHDGFAMFDSDVSDYNIVKATSWHHDPMKDLKAATQKQGMRFGFYYSQAWDWEDPNGTGNDWDYDNPAGDRKLHGGVNWWDAEPQLVSKVSKYVDHKAIPQVRELLAKYQPDLIWFDTPSKMPPSENLRVFEAFRQAAPNVVVNSRCVAQLADYASTSDRPAEFPPHDGDWEGIPTTNESYGWHQSDHSHKPASHFIQLLAKAAARGGNLMLNVGPRGDGTIDPADVAILTGIAKWMRVNGESIHGTDRTPLPVQAWGESTLKNNTLYLHVFDWPRDGKLVVGGVMSDVAVAYLLSDSSKTPLNVQRTGTCDVEISVPAEAPDTVDTVIVLQSKGALRCGERRLLSTTQTNALRSFDGVLNGHAFRFGQGKRENAYVEQWTKADEFVSWPVRVANAGTFDVTATYDAEDASTGGTYLVQAGAQQLTGTVKSGVEQSDSLGQVRLEPGEYEIRVSPQQIKGRELMRLRTLTLKPLGS